MEACGLISSMDQKAIHAPEKFNTSMDSFQSFLAVGGCGNFLLPLFRKNNQFCMCTPSPSAEGWSASKSRSFLKNS